MPKILLVDDNVDSSELLQSLLERRGFEVKAVEDAPEALHELTDFEPDLALVDIGLATMSGYDLAKQMREASASCKLVALSGNRPSTIPDLARLFDVYLVKPVELAELLRCIEDSCGPAR